MARTNGRQDEASPLDVEHELPAAETETGVAQAQPEATELARLRAERDSLLERLARAQADFDNARKRAAREQQEFREYALSDALKTLLPVVDSFDRALQAAGEKSEFRDGVELINRQLHDALGKLGLRQVPARGEPFDPRVHEAIEMVETDEVPDHHVLDELQRGYKIKDRLVRPAMVRVAKGTK
ncbi:MAG TPA: nucleotide exchange factor GrpE [Terriglobales bacterium]|jgi:molecular chaperone GrpE